MTATRPPYDPNADIESFAHLMQRKPVDHTRDHDFVVQGGQAARARALWHLLEDTSLPTVSWSISDLGEVLHGTIHADGDEGVGVQRAKLAAWGGHLAASIVRVAAYGYVHLTVHGRVYGVPVRIVVSLPGDQDPERHEEIRRLAERENAEEITAAEADRQLTHLAVSSLPAGERSQTYEQLREALKELDRIRSDMWDPAEGDKLVGGRK